MILPIRGHAASIFGKTALADTEGVLNAPNTQTLPLLQGFSSPELTATTDNDVKITAADDEFLTSSFGPLGTAADLAEDPVSFGEISLYVVRTGDTLAQIAEMFGVTPNTIIWANNLENAKIKEGDTLIILPITGVRYEIKKGDTLESIAKKFGGDVSEIRTFNGLTGESKLTIGEFVIIPDGDANLAAETRKPSTSSIARANLPTVPASYYARPLSNNSKWRKSQGFHGPYSALDLAAPTGTPILAAAGGEVIRSKDSGWNGGYGKMIIIRHDNGTQTLYGHLSKTLAETGKRVAQGELIGLVGSTGRSTGPHLHFEIRGAKARPILSELF